MTDTTPTLDVYAQLQRAYDFYNERLFAAFDHPLPPCLITLQRKGNSYGYFSRNRFRNGLDGEGVHELALNPEYFAVVPLIEVLQTLVHEQTHLYEHHYHKPPERYHSKVWADKMESIGLMPSDTGKPGGRRTGQYMADYVIEGGLFMQATEELLRSDFRFAWQESRPLRRPVPQTFIPPSWAAHLEAAELLQGDDEDEGASLVGALFTPIPTAPGVSEEAQPEKPKQTRQKFVCPACKAAAWGSPHLNLACMAHEKPVVLKATT